MRNRFDRQLGELNRNLTEMGSRCENCIRQVSALLSGAGQAGEGENGTDFFQAISEVYESDAEIDKLERTIENQCLRLLLEQQPVARDLRYISAALKMISDLERIGDQCADIADIVSFIHGEKPEGLRSPLHIRDMATATMSMVTEAVDSFIKRDLALSRRVQASDDTVDELFLRVKREIVGLISDFPSAGEMLLDYLMIAKYFERIGDHATNVGEWVEFSITGEHVFEDKYEMRQDDKNSSGRG